MSEDLREAILREEYEKYLREHAYIKNFATWEQIMEDGSAQICFNAMDSYFTIRAKELLEWMAKNAVIYDVARKTENGDWVFRYKGEWITADELFQNFL